MADLPPELPPTPMPGAKSSSAAANKPYNGEQTGNDSNHLTPEEAAHLKMHAAALAKAAAAASKSQEPRVGPNGQGLDEAVDAMSRGIASAPSTPEE